MNRRRLLHLVEAFFLFFFLAVFKLVGVSIASAMGALLGRAAFCLLKSRKKIAMANMSRAFPELSEAEKLQLVRRCFMHLGRNLGEFVHVRSGALAKRLKVYNSEQFNALEYPVFYVSAHFGMWELLPTIAKTYADPISIVYRHANNPYIERLLQWLRKPYTKALILKGPKGASKLAHALLRKQSVGMLIDQRYNQGIAVPLFGMPANTATAVAEFALRLTIPIVPVKIIRTKGAHFEATVYPPIDMPRTGDREADVYATMLAIHQLLEQWIRENPEQWYWVHKRWG